MNEMLKTVISPTKNRVLDFVDRCCCRYTPITLSFLMFVTGTIDTFGKPLNCMVPTEFSGVWTQYVHQYCYVTGTYLKLHDKHGYLLDRVYVDYYQWVPFLMFILAIAMRFPIFLWRLGQSKSDIDFQHVHELALKVRNEDEGKRLETTEQAANYIYKIAKLRGFRGVGDVAVNFYIAFKIANILTIVVMICLLTSFVGYRNPFWGITLARQVWPSNNDQNLVTGMGNQTFSYFPRIAYCMFGADFLGSPDGGMHRETRCVLGINVLNEKVFLFLFFGCYTLLTMAIINLLLSARFKSNSVRLQYVDQFLRLVNRKDVYGDALQRAPIDTKTVSQFTKRVLGNDGILLFHFIQQSVGKLVAAEICSLLYHIATQSPADAIEVPAGMGHREKGEKGANGKGEKGANGKNHAAFFE